MKNLYFITKLLVVAVICVLALGTTAWAQFYTENFSYSTGQLDTTKGGANVSGGVWYNISGNTLTLVQVNSGSLIYSGYASSNIGNRIDILSAASATEDIMTKFTTQYGTVYASFLMRVNNTTGLAANSSTTGDYFTGFSDTVSDFNYAGRFSIRLGSVAGTFNLGMRYGTGNAAASFNTTNLNVGQTYLIVMKFEQPAGTANNIASWFVNPTVGGAEPTPAGSQTSVLTTEVPCAGRLLFREGTNTPNASIDGIRIGTQWSDVDTYDASKVISASSDIVAAGNETANIPYASFQSATINTTSDGVKVWSFTIRDGGGSADIDALPTTLSSVTINKGAGNGIASWANTIREAALFDGTTKLGEVSVTGETITFSGLTVAAPDDGNKTLDLYLTFETSATDNSQYQFQVTNANVTAPTDASSSTFSAFSNSTSSTTGDADRVEVVASKIAFTTEPPSTLAQNNAFTAGVTAEDANNNADLDYVTPITLSRDVAHGTGVLSSSSGLTKTPVNGAYTWTDLKYDIPESGVELYATDGSLTGTSTAFTCVALSAASDIIAGPDAEPASISSLVITSGAEVEVFDIIARDGGGTSDGDAVPTIVDTLKFQQGGTNSTTDWTQYIGGAELFKDGGSLGMATITSTKLTFKGAPLFTVPDDGNDTLQVKVYLKNPLPVGADGKIVNLKVNQNADVSIDPSGSLFGNGGVDVSSASTAVDVAVTQIQFASTIPTEKSGVAFNTSVTGTDTYGNIDKDYSATVNLTVTAGNAVVSGTHSAAAAAGTATISGMILSGSAFQTLQASDGSLSTSSNSFALDSAATFIVNNLLEGNAKQRIGFFVMDTLYWNNPQTWAFSAGYDADSIPDANDHVILDNTIHSGSYVVMLSSTKRDTAAWLWVGYPHNPNTIVAQIPSTDQLPFYIGDGLAGNYDLLIDSGGVFNNFAAGPYSTVGNNIFVTGYSPAKDTVWIRKGGKVNMFTNAGCTFMYRASQRRDGDYGTVEFDAPDNSAGYQVAASGGFFPNLIFDATAAGGHQVYYNTASSGFGNYFVKGNLTVNTGAVDSLPSAFSDSLELWGDLINYGTVKTSCPIYFNGQNGQEVSGNSITCGNGFVANDPANVNLQSDLMVTGGTGYVTAGEVNTVNHTVYLNPNGNLSEIGGTVTPHVSATRVLSATGVNNTFGGIGLEINPTLSIPDSTTVNRTTGTYILANTNQSIRRYFDVTTKNASPMYATFGFFYFDTELNGNPEGDLFLNYTTDGGTTWVGKQAFSNSTTLNKVVTTGINSNGRYTLASASQPLYIANSIAMKKFENDNGDISSPGTAKKWYMALYQGSIAPANVVNSGNFSVVNTAELPNGKYICQEADSAGWVHEGHKIDNGVTHPIIAGGLSYDTINVSNGAAGDFEFYNSKSASITVNKFRDLDGDPLTVGDQTAQTWGLSLYKDSVSGSPVASGNTTSLVANNIAAGTYIAVEADSAGWYRCDGTTDYDTVTIAGSQSTTVKFVNVKANTIAVNAIEDDDGVIATTADQSPKAWYFEIHKGSASGPLMTSGSGLSVSYNKFADGTYYVVEADSSPWVSLGYKINGTYSGGSAGMLVGSITVANGQPYTFTFYNAPPIYGTKFRAFNPDSIALDVDNAGKIGKSVKLKADKVQFEASFVVPNSNLNDLHIEFGVAIDTTWPFTTNPASTHSEVAKSKEGKWDFTFASTLDSGSTVTVSGYGVKGTLEKVSSYYWTHDGTMVGKKLTKGATLVSNILRLPMPNRINVLEQTFAQGGFGTKPNIGMTIGLAQTVKDSIKKYGWVFLSTSANVQKSLSVTVKKVVLLHNGTPRGLDSVVAGKSMKSLVGKKTLLSPAIQNNQLFADLVAFKLSIQASLLDKTPVGFGDLILNDTAANPWNGKTLSQLAVKADSMMTGYPGRTFENAGTYAKLASTIRSILNAFEGPIDTASFSGKLALHGAQPLVNCKILKADPNATPSKIIPTSVATVDVPEQYSLYQNYPNPFNPTTTIQFDLPLTSTVTLKVYNILGQEVATLLDHSQMDGGQQSVQFNAGNYASGVYLYRITAQSVNDAGVTNTFSSVKKMILMK